MRDPRFVTGPSILDRIADIESRLTTLEGGQRSVTHCYISNSGAVSIPDAATTAVTFDTDDSDPDDMHDTGSNTDRITIPTDLAGWYHVEGYGFFAAAGGGSLRLLQITVNGAAVLRHRHPVVGERLTISGEILLADADIVRLTAYQDSGGALNLDNSELRITQIFRT